MTDYQVIDGELIVKVILEGEEVEIKRKLTKEQMIKVMEVLE